MDNQPFVTEKQNQACENVPMIKVGNHCALHMRDEGRMHTNDLFLPLDYANKVRTKFNPAAGSLPYTAAISG